MGFKKKAAAAVLSAVMCASFGFIAGIPKACASNSGESAVQQEIRDITSTQNDWIGNIFYTGKAIEPEVVLHDYSRGYVLVEGTDYTLSFENNTNAGRAKITAKGMGVYQGQKVIEFDIGKYPFYKDTTVTPSAQSFGYTGSAITPNPTVICGGRKLTKGVDFTVTYQNNVNLGTPTITVTGKGNYEGTAQTTFNIVQNSIANDIITLPKTSYPYTGSAIKPVPTVKVSGKTLVKDRDYTVAYSANKAIGTAKVTVTGKGNYKGKLTAAFKITAPTIPSLKPATASDRYAYTGKAIKPDVVMKVGGTKLVKGTDYTLTYKNNTAVGKATVTVKGKGRYTGSKNVSFMIIPKKQTGVKGTLNAAGTSVKLTWTKNTTGNGYRIYKYNSSTKGYDILKDITTNATTAYTVSGLKTGGTYYYKIRAFKKIGTKTYYGVISDTLKVTSPEKGTPVANHGRLKVSGANIVDKNGRKFQIIGMSTHGLMWEDFSDITSKASLKVLRDDWGVNTIRLAMYTEEYAGYTTSSSNAAAAKKKVETGVKNATDLGMYAIIDWHILKDGNPQKHQKEAVAFFTEMAKKYKGQNNIIYEICNEPNGGVTWAANIKPYCQAVVNAIRKYDKNAIIVCGTGTWSQDIDKVVNSRLSDANCVYTLHFYANTHTDWLRNRVTNCYSKGLPILVTEFGTCDASGNGGYNASQTKTWLTLLDKYMIGYCNWSACGKAETASAFKSGTNLAAIKSGTSQLTESGKLIRSLYRKRTGK